MGLPLRLGLETLGVGAPPLPWGARHPLGRPPRRLDLLGPAPPPLDSLYIVGKGGPLRHIFGASLSLSNTSSSSIVLGEALPEYCSSINTTPPCCCWCHLPQPLLPPCWIKKEETWLFRTCVERGGAVRSVLGSPVIWITSCSTTSSPFFERFRSRSTRYVDASNHSLLDELIDGSW